MDLYQKDHQDHQKSNEESVKTNHIDMPLSLVDEELLEKFNTIPDKMAFKIGEVAEILGVKQYVLRYWETEFEELNPKKSGNNQRLYTRKNIETALLIQKLLHRDRFSIEGARKILKNSKQDMKRQLIKDNSTFNAPIDIRQELQGILSDLKYLKKLFT